MSKKVRIQWGRVFAFMACMLCTVIAFVLVAYMNTHSLHLGRVDSVQGQMVTFDVNGQLYSIQEENTKWDKGDHVRILFKDNEKNNPYDDEIIAVFKAW